MTDRYSKVITRLNLQLFVGGLLLTSTAGYAWLAPRLRQTVELQDQLEKIRQHMYWSMSLAQRSPPASAASNAHSRRSKPHRARKWWNTKVFAFNTWALQPGYLQHSLDRTRTLVTEQADSTWHDTKLAAACAGHSALSWLKDAARWDDAVRLVHQLWAAEKSKWGHAHKHAVEAVHPHYQEQGRSYVHKFYPKNN
ncbi:hypothetical protein GGI07_005563 [Coemansia sp. Benny D115]|nr:hypothetical protein GGI07_005563 [Coemansia sp. Benny D115]